MIGQKTLPETPSSDTEVAKETCDEKVTRVQNYLRVDTGRDR